MISFRSASTPRNLPVRAAGGVTGRACGSGRSSLTLRRCGRAAISAGCSRAGCVSNAGNAVAVTAANWQVYGLTHSSLAVGLLTLADSAGMLVGLLAGGMLADRHDRRKLLIAVRLPQALLSLLMLVNSLLPHPGLWPIYVLTLGIGLLSGLGQPGRHRRGARRWSARAGWRRRSR